jgi:hypothetical protein
VNDIEQGERNMIARAAGLFVILAAAVASAYEPGNWKSVNEYAQEKLVDLRAEMSGARAAQARGDYDGDKHRGAANMAVNLEQELASEFKHASKGSAADKAKARAIMAEAHKLREEAAAVLLVLWDHRIDKLHPDARANLAEQMLDDLRGYVGVKDKRLLSLAKKKGCRFDGGGENALANCPSPRGSSGGSDDD